MPRQVLACSRRAALTLAVLGSAGAAAAPLEYTLDPAATGLLVVCADDAVKLQHWLADGDKGYEATVAFGAATDTEDAEGQVVERGDPASLDADPMAAALRGFVGEIDQLPPMYSAVRGSRGLRKRSSVRLCSTSSPSSMNRHSSLARRAWAMLWVTITMV